MKVLSLCGLPGSGKSTAIEAVKDLGLVITMGDVIRNEAKHRNLQPTAENLGRIARELRIKYGPDIIARKCVELIKKQEEEIIFLDGIRSLSEVKVFREFWKFPVIAIIADEKLRLERLMERERDDDPKSLAELKIRDEREIGFGLNEVIENSDYRIYNNSTIEELKKKTRELVIKIIKNY
ncbi:MAG: AAA family ATPase [Promethearchaeota archaeon]